jgi:hypothetical protein
MAGRGRRAVAGECFARWRRGRVRGARIPQELWQLAIELAGRYGVSCVARVVRVGYYELQKQCRLATERVDSTPRTLSERTPRFIVSFRQACVNLSSGLGTMHRFQIHTRGGRRGYQSRRRRFGWKRCDGGSNVGGDHGMRMSGAFGVNCGGRPPRSRGFRASRPRLLAWNSMQFGSGGGLNALSLWFHQLCRSPRGRRRCYRPIRSRSLNCLR